MPAFLKKSKVLIEFAHSRATGEAYLATCHTPPSQTDAGILVVSRVPLVTEPNADNLRYLRTKQSKMGHLLGLPDDAATTAARPSDRDCVR